MAERTRLETRLDQAGAERHRAAAGPRGEASAGPGAAPVVRSEAVLSFGVTVLPDPPWQRLVELLRLAEQSGFEYGWTYDSHVLWQEPYPLLTLAAMNTERLRLGLNVTNPGTREPTVTA